MRKQHDEKAALAEAKLRAKARAEMAERDKAAQLQTEKDKKQKTGEQPAQKLPRPSRKRAEKKPVEIPLPEPEQAHREPVEVLTFTVSPELAGLRLDQCLPRLHPSSSRSRLQGLVKDKYVSVNGDICDVPRRKMAEGETITLSIPPEKEHIKAEAENIELEVLFEDDQMLVINKAPGMVVHPAAGNWTGTVVNAILGRDPDIADEFGESEQMRPGIVHRLDKDTSGCLVIAKTPDSLFKLSEAFANRAVTKKYLAIVWGWPKLECDEIKTLIGRHPADRQKMAVVRFGGRMATTRYRVIERGYINGFRAALVELKIFTGRTHQIRVHMAHLGNPVAGDYVYCGSRKIEAPRQMLHAWKLMVPHPVTGRNMRFEAPFPEDFQTMLDSMEEF